MINIRNSFIIITIALSVICCTSEVPKPSEDYMVLEQVEYIDKFHQTVLLDKSIEIDLDIIGIKDFAIHDSILFTSTIGNDHLLNIFSTYNYNPRGSFLKQGEGPIEFISTPFISQQLISNNGLCVYIYDFNKGRLITLESVSEAKTEKSVLSVYKDALPSSLQNFIMIDSTTFYCKEVDDVGQKQIRYILKNDEVQNVPVLEVLNKATIRKNEDHNILSTLTKYNPDKKIFIEVPIGLNYINMFNLDGSFTKTICTYGKLDNITKIQNTKEENRMYTFSDIRLFKDFFGVVSIHEKKGTYFSKREKLPTIQLFNWEGNPLIELQLKHHITSFDIDLENQYLYTLDLHSDDFVKYNIKDVLEKLKKLNSNQHEKIII